MAAGAAMQNRPVGRAGLTVSAVGLGGGNWGREVDEETSYRVMDYAVENGVTFFDTGDLYGGGQSFETRKRIYGADDQRETTLEMHSSEKIIGRWMASRGCRSEITLCTKVGSGGSAENIGKSLARSLDHFGTDRVDIYKLHRHYDDVPVEETLGAMAEQVSSGRARAIGASNHTEEQVREALEASARHGWPRFDVLQLPYSLAAPDIEDDLLPLARQERIAVTAYSPLAAGFLTGKYDRDPDKWPRGSRYHIMPSHADQYFSDRSFRILDLLKVKEAELGIPSIQLAMAWAMTHPDVTAVLTGARNSGQIDTALAALKRGMDPDLRAEMASWTREPLPRHETRPERPQEK